MGKHGIMTAMRSGRKVKDLQCKAKTPLGDKRRNLVYKVECGCEECVYIGQTGASWEERRKQHQDKIRLTKEKLTSNLAMERKEAEINMAGQSGRLYEHAAKECDKEVNWESATPVRMEKGWKQRKVK